MQGSAQLTATQTNDFEVSNVLANGLQATLRDLAEVRAQTLANMMAEMHQQMVGSPPQRLTLSINIGGAGGVQ